MSFHISENVCATTPNNHHYIMLCAQNTQTGETVWAIGDDQVCAITKEDCIRNKGVRYNDVLIQEFPYKENTPESVGDWRPLIEELVRWTLRKHLEHDGQVHVYPQWLPADVSLSMEPEAYQQLKEHLDHLILYDNDTLEMVFSNGSGNLELHSKPGEPILQM